MRIVHFLVAVVVLSLFPHVAAGDDPGIAPSGKRDRWSWTLMDAAGIGLGGGGLDADDVQYVYDQGFRAILNYRVEYPDDEAAISRLGMDHLFIPTAHAESSTMPLEDVIAAVDWIEARLAEGTPVYVHCTAGHHRSAAGVAAYFMKTNGWRADEAFAYVKSIRPTAENRWADALYAYEAYLFNETKLDVDLTTRTWDIVPGETVPVTAYVTNNGNPVEGARVEYEPEYRDIVKFGITDAEGVATFSFTANDNGNIQYVHAIATKSGYVAGYDRNQYWVGKSKPSSEVALHATLETPHVFPNELVTILAKVEKTNGQGGDKVRFTVSDGCQTYYRNYTDWDGHATITFNAPDNPGTYTLLVHANRFRSGAMFEALTLVVGGGGPELGCDAPRPWGSGTPGRPTPSTSSTPAPDVGSTPDSRLIPMPPTVAVVIIGLGAAWARRRA